MDTARVRIVGAVLAVVRAAVEAAERREAGPVIVVETALGWAVRLAGWTLDAPVEISARSGGADLEGYYRTEAGAREAAEAAAAAVTRCHCGCGCEAYAVAVDADGVPCCAECGEL